MPKAVDYYLLNQGATLARVEDRVVHCVASVFRKAAGIERTTSRRT